MKLEKLLKASGQDRHTAASAHRCWPVRVTSKPHIKEVMGREVYSSSPGGSTGGSINTIYHSGLHRVEDGENRTQKKSSNRAVQLPCFAVERTGSQKREVICSRLPSGIRSKFSFHQSSALSLSPLASASRSPAVSLVGYLQMPPVTGTPGPTYRRGPHKQA